MNPQRFIDTLRRIGYPKANNLDPQALEWAFENESALPFLEWFCNSISEENLLSQTELDEYKSIEESGNSVSGPQLDEALRLKTLFTASSGADTLEHEVEQLQETLVKTKAQKQTLMTRCNKLSVHNMGLRNKVSKMEEAEEQAFKACRHTVDKCHNQNAKIGAALQSLVQSVEHVTSLYAKPSTQKGTGNNADVIHFLSQTDLQAFHEAEEKYSHDLTAFTKKQFFEGIGDIAGERETARYDILDVSTPENVQVEGDDRDAFVEDCQEFSRLRQIFPKSECDRINALVGAKKSLSAVHEARSILHTLKSNQFPTAPSTISGLQRATEQKMEAVKAEAAPLLSSLPALIRELGSLHGTEILTGDYDLKLRRQDYFTKNQSKVIDHLVCQRARNEILTMLYDLETKWHRETHHLLSAARQMLDKYLFDWQQRMRDLDDPDLTVKKFERSVVDTRDTSTARLYQLMGDGKKESESSLCLPKQKVVERARDLHDRHKAAQASDETMDEKYMNKMNQLENCVKDCETCLYEGSTTFSGQPALSPPQIQAAIAKLMAQLDRLDTEIMSVISDVKNKKAVLKNNILLSKEKELFVLFHTNPSRLQYVVNGLADRLKAHDVLNAEDQ